MTLATVTPSIRIGKQAVIQGSWRALAEQVRADAPEVVVLIARKMPRLVELFGLDFGPHCLVISDMAIPFCHALIRGRRVAIVDDLVNCGSTLEHARDCVFSCDSSNIRLYALAKRSSTTLRVAVECLYADPLQPEQYQELVASVPQHLQRLNKPYDLEFPVIPCQILPPWRTPVELLAKLRTTYGSAAVHDLSVCGNDERVSRITIDLGSDSSNNYKIRLYIDGNRNTCNLVPFAIPHNLDAPPVLSHPTSIALLSTLVREIADAPIGTTLWLNEPICRARLFAASLDFGLSALSKFNSVFAATSVAFSSADAQLLFGPAVASVSAREFPPAAVSTALANGHKSDHGESPFWTKFIQNPEHKFLKRISQNLHPGFGATDLLAMIFEVLAEMVGASDARAYILDWPYPKEDIVENPYLRLRVGPTFSDLIRIYQELRSTKDVDVVPARNVVSAALDCLIDCGAVVPTLGCYDGTLYRIYRQGESKRRNAALHRFLYGWHNYGPMSLTRATKVDTILSFSSRLGGLTVPTSFKHGTVSAFGSNCLDERNVEIAEYARDIGRLQEMTGDASVQ